MTKYKRIPLETLVNARDLGGYAAGAGKITKYGVFLRTDCPIGISPGDAAYLRAYGITMSIDLRGNDEAAGMPSGLRDAPGHRYVHCPISETHSILKGGEDGGESKAPPPLPEGNFDMGDSYIDILEGNKAWAKKVVGLCTDWQEGVMFHCFIGKDRAGLIAALLLGAAGVGDTDILMDYSASMSCLRPKYADMAPAFLPRKRGRPDYSWGFFGSVPESMEAVLCHLKEAYGGVSEYLLACGVAPETLARLRGKFVEDA